MTELPLVTVIIASYNHAPYIEESILSVIEQTYPNIELLVVDDGSKDDSVERIRRLHEKYGFDFRVQPNQGLSRTLNESIARAKGSLIAPLGSDDVMLSERIATQVAYMEGKPEVGICAGNIKTIDAQGNLIQKRCRARPFRRLDFNSMFNALEDGPPAPTLLFRREALQAVGGFDPTIRLEDLQVELKIAYAGYFIDVLSEVLAKYRVHGANTYKDRRFMVEQVMATYACFSDHPDYPSACAKFLNSMVLKSARDDKQLSRELLRQLPVRFWNGKTIRGLVRLVFG
ncbi:MAG TPA: glycosyl transferase [Pseudomonas sp.]|jgi:alpha-1,3-rhamnosyltransferase|uniref:glycosyltransferase n=1 Tax=Stutzerimonas xanthomarina TaxID=271420 RepID=UPI000E933E85|nr:glycosyltransferase [Stutzerimonas xanthomarina]MBU0813392.1 glycosyltransferase [Gammaproteobacteria bacterium]HAQ84981.1 glycosyl transferase [Pseudomonas sp.]MBK3849134.1 glycosyltransferase [Stutzerimonas xanthomarina]MBU0851288.1 glycosyltransferase [Gammaproteobacteria bacterium]MBU1300917.1 glycosyltransferase [Gammaproteobacteria bacterium]|tara:strand:- start:6213 stop:7073 length:861 start_codon:yes stop_codon:yes gene_type:complete